MGYRILALLVLLGLAACRPAAEVTPVPAAATTEPVIISTAPLPTNTPLPVAPPTNTPLPTNTPPPTLPTNTPTVQSQPEATPTVSTHGQAAPSAEISPYSSSGSSVPTPGQVSAGYIGFRNNLGVADQFVFNLSSAPAPPAGQTYRGWLISADGAAIDIGPLTVNPDGSAALVWNSPNSENLLGRYARMEITLEPAAGDNGSIGPAVWVCELAGDKLTAARRIFVKNDGDPATPLNTAFALGLAAQTDVAVQHVDNAVNAAAIGALPEMRTHLEHVINILEGAASPRFGDHDGSGSAENPGDGFGAAGYAAQIAQALNEAAVTQATQEFQNQVTVLEDKSLEILKQTDMAAAATQLRELKTMADQLKAGPMTNLYRAAQEAASFEVKAVE